MVAEKAIWLRHPDYNPDRAQKLISSSMSRHLSTRNISSKSMHTFLSNLANRHRQTRANAFNSSIVGGNNFCTQSGYFTKFNVMFKFKFLALVVSDISGASKFVLGHCTPLDAI